MKNTYNNAWLLIKKLTLATVIFGGAVTASAQVNISFVETGSNVVATFSGSLMSQPTSGWAYLGSGARNNDAVVYNNVAGFGVDLATSSSLYYENVVSGVTLAGGSSVPWNQVNGVATSGTNSGGFRLYTGNKLYYYAESTTPSPTFDATVTFYNTTLAGLGFDSSEISAGSGSFSLVAVGNPSTVYETVTWSVTAAAIPEPSTYAAFAGVAALGLAYLKRRKSVVAA